jgi:hypothetical protein
MLAVDMAMPGADRQFRHAQTQLATPSRSGHVGEKDRSENVAAEWFRGYGPVAHAAEPCRLSLLDEALVVGEEVHVMPGFTAQAWLAMIKVRT